MSRRLTALNAWLRLVAKPVLAATPVSGRSNARIAQLASIFLPRPRNLRHEVEQGDPSIHWIRVGTADPGCVILHFHGGAYVAGGPGNRLGMLGRLSLLSGLTVAAPAYRLAPGHGAPAQFEDARAAHARLLDTGLRPGSIVLGGDSAGGGLALALLADLCERDLRPAGLYAVSPWVDLTLSGRSIADNAARDPFVPATRLEEITGHVLQGLAADDPRISPLFAEFPAPPPVQLHVGSTEILRDDARRMAQHLRAAGGVVELREWPDVPHIWTIFDGYVPEARAALREISTFARSRVPAKPNVGGALEATGLK